MLNKNLVNLLRKNKKNIAGCRIVCIGDIILDHYINGKVERMSPEAPIPILIKESQYYQIGGVGNVARNISKMGGKPTLIHLSSNDDSSILIKKLLLKEKNIRSTRIKIPDFKTPVKIRFTNNKNHLLRVDDEDINFKLSSIYRKLIIKKIENEIKKNDLIVLSDYNKGLLDNLLIKKIIRLSLKYNKIIIADPKKIDLSVYSNVSMLTPNQKEITDAAKKIVLNEKELIYFGKKLIKKYKINNLLVTRSEKGMLLIDSKSVIKFKTVAKKVIDVTGAGDTVIATLALMLSLKLTVEESIKISNYAAAKVVGKNGTRSVSYSDLIK